MGDLKIGEYYRTKKGLIRKINTIHTPETRGVSYRKSNVLLVNGKHSLEDIEKHDKDILNLIKPGDYINGSKLLSIEYAENEMGNCDKLHYYYSFEDVLKDVNEYYDKLIIETIVTKEQFENMEYKIGG